MPKKLIFTDHFLHQDLTCAYQEMAMDEKREKEADEWIEGTIGIEGID